MLIARSIITSLAFTAANAFTLQAPHHHRSLKLSTQVMATPQTGDVVTVTYSLTPEGDFTPNPLFNDGDVSFVLGRGNYLPALHSLVSTMSPGETQSGISMDAGYGEPRADLIAKVPIASSGISPSELEVGKELFLANGMKCKVTEMDDENFTIDCNDELCGASYSADVTLHGFESGPSEAQFGYNPEAVDGKYDVLTIALGCFWGGELEYMRVPGVVGTKLGYTQGQKDDPTYEEVCSGTTGHTEAMQVIFDPSIVGYDKLVEIGLERLGTSRTLVNQVGNDRGTQYRHGVYYHNYEQMIVAKSVIGRYANCVTECMEATKFFEAEDYHQQYLLKGGQSAKKNASEIIRCYG